VPKRGVSPAPAAADIENGVKHWSDGEPLVPTPGAPVSDRFTLTA